MTKKQIVVKVEKDAEEHRLINRRQEKEDNARIYHAVKDLDVENQTATKVYSRIHTALVISIIIIFVLVAASTLFWYFIFYG